MMPRTGLIKELYVPIALELLCWKIDTWKRVFTFFLMDEWGPNCKQSFSESHGSTFSDVVYIVFWLCPADIPVIATNLAVWFPQTHKICSLDVFINTIFLKKPQQTSKKPPTKLEHETPLVSPSEKKQSKQGQENKIVKVKVVFFVLCSTLLCLDF